MSNKVEDWQRVCGWIHDKVDTFDGDCEDRRHLIHEIGRVLDFAFGDMSSALKYLGENDD